jgi:ATP-dependent Clp protease ATP-binding subunit ClpC
VDLNRFSQNAREVLDIATAVVRRGRANLLGTEHVLLGLLAQQEGVVHRVFEELGLDLGLAQAKTNDAIRRNDLSRSRTSGERVQTTPNARNALRIADEEAEKNASDHIGTEHLLLGLVLVEEGTAAGVLREVGLIEPDLRRVLGRVRGESALGEDPDSLLGRHGRNITRLAREGKLDPVVGRDEEIKRMFQILSRRTKNNPALIGEPGVGKTAIVEGLAQRIVSEDIPEVLKGKRVLALDVGGLVAGTRFRGDFEERMRQMIQELQAEEKNIILFIDELHSIVGAGGAEGAVNASSMLKPALARGELQVVGATTLDEYRKHVEKDPALERRFQPVLVSEPTVDESVGILFGLRDRYEAHHRVKISDEAIIAAAQLSDRYITDRYLPDKAIDLLDEAAAEVRLRSTVPPVDVKRIEGR